MHVTANRKFTSITEADHSSIFEPVDALMKLSARLCIAVRYSAFPATDGTLGQLSLSSFRGR